jgi:PhnB protein
MLALLGCSFRIRQLAHSCARRAWVAGLNSDISVKDAAAFLTIAESAFAAQILQKHEDGSGLIVRAKCQIGDTALEISDSHGQWGPRTVALHYTDCDAVFAQALRAGAKHLLPFTDRFYGERVGSRIDNWGNHWYIASHIEDSVEEIYRRASAGASESAT